MTAAAQLAAMAPREGACVPGFDWSCKCEVRDSYKPVSRPSFCRVPPGMHSIQLHKWHAPEAVCLFVRVLGIV